MSARGHGPKQAITAPPPALAGDAELLDARTRLLSLINANWTTQAISVATQLRLPELLHGAPQTADALAHATGCHAPSLARLLRALTSIDVVGETADGRFTLTPTGELLRADMSGSLAAWAEFCGTRSWATWGCLLDSIRTGNSRRKRLRGDDGFRHLDDDAHGALLFHRAMVDLTRPVAAALARTIDWSGVAVLVDVGGGHGELLAAVLRDRPAMRGILLELAHATAAAGTHLAAAGVLDRCTLVTGSFFDAVPDAADAYLLKSVLHDWDDDRVVAILHNCRRVMAPHARLLIVERIAPEQLADSPHDQGVARSDLNMLVGTGGRERTDKQYRELLAMAQLRVTRLLPVTEPYQVIESVPEIKGFDVRHASFEHVTANKGDGGWSSS